MKTAITEMFAIEAPVFAFSHCRDVVVATSKAGGFGVLGAAWMTPEHLEQELKWIDDHIDGKPYGVDMVFTSTASDISGSKNPREILPREQVDYINGLMTRDGVPELPQEEVDGWYQDYAANLSFTQPESEALFEVAMRHPVRFVVSALGIAPPHVIQRVHDAGLKFGALVGSARQAQKQVEAGVDVIVAQGTEAGGHTGDVASMVLWPEVVDAVAPVPVLAAGGIGRGRQMAAALALGAEGIWCGTIWLGTVESELAPDMRDVLYAARSADAVITYGYTGKPCRALRSKFTEAWAAQEAPEPLKVPYQSILSGEPFRRAERAHRKDWMTYAAGQVVGQVNEPKTVKQVMYDMLNEYLETTEKLNTILEA
ncbi:NAD(P)H-dependent flavin oxidoreductase YrpB (nitropropane dioxygenase family) [Angulomicrobium tetraedrale]|uniref:NAD(P)H-dependent flavin oxidoreductase YrpB (Nitropropane dioxygenase family) n=1 Tax=Ancylobacter tetraedralis TaxID=217068 RepID=A0A839ZFP6_9HYPH|nr:NAD(P)H-dependent flavin oxidoreductase YrpB (nitropropane dioxygenase family) [Ancylobacter tetraedralis]